MNFTDEPNVVKIGHSNEMSKWLFVKFSPRDACYFRSANFRIATPGPTVIITFISVYPSHTWCTTHGLMHHIDMQFALAPCITVAHQVSLIIYDDELLPFHWQMKLWCKNSMIRMPLNMFYICHVTTCRKWSKRFKILWNRKHQIIMII